MKLNTLVLICLSLCVAAGDVPQEKLKQVKIPERTHNFLLVFTAEWCQPCKSVRPELVRLKEEGWNAGYLETWQPILVEGTDKEVAPIIIINIDKHPDLAKEYQVESIPLIIKVENGKVVRRRNPMISSNQSIDWKQIAKFYVGK